MNQKRKWFLLAIISFICVLCLVYLIFSPSDIGKGKIEINKPESQIIRFDSVKDLSSISRGDLLQELSLFISYNGQIITIKETQYADNFIFVTSNGLVQLYDMKNSATTDEIYLDYPIKPGSIYFYDKNYKLLFTTDEEPGTAQVMLYDLENDNLLETIQLPINEQGALWKFYSIDPTGRYLLTNFTYGLLVTDKVERNSYGLIWIDEMLKHFGSYDEDLIALTVDELGDYIAIIMESRDIFIDSLSERVSGGGVYIAGNEFTSTEGVKDFLFSPNRKYIALLSNERLTVWRFSARTAKQIIEEQISDASTLIFDRYSQYLFVGTKNVLLIYDLQTQNVIQKYDIEGIEGEVICMYVSQDNRILVWGDSEGAVHFLGIPDE